MNDSDYEYEKPGKHQPLHPLRSLQNRNGMSAGEARVRNECIYPPLPSEAG